MLKFIIMDKQVHYPKKKHFIMKKLCILPLQYIWNIIIFFQIINCDVKKKIYDIYN